MAHIRVTRRSLLAFGVAQSAAIGMLAACGAAAGPATAATSAGSISASTSTAATLTAPANAAAAKPTATPLPAHQVGKGATKIRFESRADAGIIPTWNTIVDAFVKANPDISVSHEPVSGSAYERYTVEYAGGTAPDVMEFEVKQLVAWGGKGVLLTLDPYVAKSAVTHAQDFFPITWSKCLYQGKPVAIPYDTTPVAIFYNPDLFKAAGVPLPPKQWGSDQWTWDTFLSAAQKLTKADGSQFGYNQSTWWVYSLPWIWSNGGHVVNKDITKATMTETPVTDAVQWLVDLMWKYKVWPDGKTASKLGPPDPFFVGKYAMATNGTYYIPAIKAGIKVKWDLAPIPTGKAGVWTRDPSDSLAANGHGQNKDAAWKFVEFFTGPQGEELVGHLGRGIPARASVARSDKFLNQGDGIDWKVFVDATSHEGVQPVTDVWPTMDATISKGTGKMWGNQASAKDAYTALEQQVQAVLDQAKARRDLSTYLPVGWSAPQY